MDDSPEHEFSFGMFVWASLYLYICEYIYVCLWIRRGKWKFISNIAILGLLLEKTPLRKTSIVFEP
jgi:hypothetical protein